jgi:hypothetical protein
MNLRSGWPTGTWIAVWLGAWAQMVGCGGGSPSAPSPTPQPTPPDAGRGQPLTTERYTWRNVTIVGGGFVPGIIFNAKERDLMYARTDIGGAYRWDASTRSWLPLTDWVSSDDSNLLGIESLATDPVDPNRVYLAAGTYTQSWAGNGAILRSTDKGQTWQRTNMSLKMGGNEDGRSMGERLAIDPNQNSTLYFGSRNDGLWRSTDSGTSWSKVSSFPVTGNAGLGLPIVWFDARGGSSGSATRAIYVAAASTSDPLYRSADAGATWQAVPGQPQAFMPHHAALDSAGMLYVTYGNGPGPNGVTNGAVWRCDTATGNWVNVTPVTPGGSDNFGYAGLAVDASRAGTVMVSTLDRWNRKDEIYRTTDGGASWTAIGARAVRDSSAAPYLNWGDSSAALGHWIGDVEIDPFDSNHVLYVTGATIWASNNATAADANQTTNWVVRAQGLEETAVLDLASPPSGANLISALGDVAGFRHDDFTQSPRSGLWTNPMFTTTDAIDFAEGNPDIVARVGWGSSARGAYSLDGASTWAPFSGTPQTGDEAGSIAVSADDSTFVWAPTQSPPSYSRSRGASWTRCAGISTSVRVVADRVNANKVYAFDSASGAVYASTDGGATFSARATGLPTGNNGLCVAPGQEGHLWLEAANGGLYRSVDSGAQFTRLSSAQTAQALGFGKAASGQSYPALYMTGKVESVAGVFRSDTVGASWVRINDDQHQYGWIGRAVTGDPRIYGRVYLGTNGRGVLYADPAP